MGWPSLRASDACACGAAQLDKSAAAAKAAQNADRSNPKLDRIILPNIDKIPPTPTVRSRPPRQFVRFNTSFCNRELWKIFRGKDGFKTWAMVQGARHPGFRCAAPAACGEGDGRGNVGRHFWVQNRAVLLDPRPLT